MDQQISFSKKDLFASIVIGEIAAWLIFVLAKGLVPLATHEKFSKVFLMLPVAFPIICAVCLYAAHLIGKKIAIIYQIAKFVLVGGLNTLVDWGILSLLIYLFGRSKDVLFTVLSLTIIYYSLYKSISFILSATNSYIWNKLWTFKRKTEEKVAKEFTQFLIITILGFLINVGIASGIFTFIQPIGPFNSDQWGIIAAVVATVVSMIWNFLGYKFIVFDSGKSQAPPIAGEPEQQPPPRII